MLRTYKMAGYDVVGFVGHDEMANVKSEELLVINGIEHTKSTNPEVHVVEFPSMDFSFLAHPSRISNITSEAIANLARRHSVDAIERFNNGVGQDTADLDLPQVCNSDAHNVFQVDTSYMTLESMRQRQAVINAIKNGDVELRNNMRRPFGKAVKWMDVSLGQRDINL